MKDLPAGLAAPLAALFGLYVGSFLNVCIFRMPAHRSVVFPRSACPACGTVIPLWHNIPVLSWFILRGRCASCRAPIALRYPVVEALTGGVFLAASLRFGIGWDLAHALVFLCALIVLFFTDLDERILPDRVTIPGIAAGLAFALVREAPGLSGALAAAAGGASAFWLLGRLWRLVRPEIETAIGLGDVKMMAMIGAFLGPARSILTVFLGSLLGTALFVAGRILAKWLPGKGGGAAPIRRFFESAGFLVGDRAAGMLDQIPFGSMLALGAAASLFFGDAIIDVYFGLAGLRE